MKILIAEDEAISRAVLAGVLKKNGHEVVETINGIQAWEVLQQPDPPKLVILDWMMPEMDGPEVLRLARSQQTDRPPYIIMLTAKDDKDYIIAGLAAGANDYLTKPFDPGELIVRVEVGERMVEMQLRQHRQRAHAQRIRVETDQRMVELQDSLATRTEELRQTQADLRAMSARIQTLRDQERAIITRELDDSMGDHLASLRAEMMALDAQLRALPSPDPATLSEQVAAMLRRLERLTEQTLKIRSSLRP